MQIPNLELTGWLLIKLATIFGLVIYNIFAFVVIKQVNLMTETLSVDLEKVIKGIAALHFIFALCILIYAIFI